ncbi:hypothetical protein ACFLV7_00575 [Chloroflexota bacterium]
MTEDLGTSNSYPVYEEPSTKSNRTLVIILVVLILLCCCCTLTAIMGWGGWTYGDEIFGGYVMNLGTLSI